MMVALTVPRTAGKLAGTLAVVKAVKMVSWSVAMKAVQLAGCWVEQKAADSE